MLWLVIIISSYFLFAITSLIDKHLLTEHIPSAKVYAFYVGILNILALVLVPLGFFIPGPFEIALSLLAGAMLVFAIFALYNALIKFEVSRVVPAIGGILPLFTLGLVYLFSGGRETLTSYQLLAFCVLIVGSVLIVFEKEKKITLKSLQISILAAFLFSLSFVLFKFVYISQPFWSGFIWMRLGGFLAALLFLFSKEVREEIFRRKKSFRTKTAKIFFFNQVIGSSAFMLQNWAIALVPLASLAFLNAMEGVRYVFLLLFVVLISLMFPKILKEEISPKILLQKIVAILLIVAGLVILSMC